VGAGPVTVFGDRLRRAALAAGDALGRRRPEVELVRLDRPELLAPLPPQPLPALPPPALPMCPRCRTRHEPRPHPAGGRGLAALYGQQVVPDPNRPTPLGRQADETPLELRRFRPWSGL
jgi:hypothetical protein